MKSNYLLKPLIALSITALAGCGTSLPEQNQSARHIYPESTVAASDIPDIVNSSTILPVPSVQDAPELFSVVVQDVSVRELLFAIARDADVNIDVHPGVLGTVSINAIDQTLPQLLERIGRQVDMRWVLDPVNGIMVEPDSPYLQSYRIDYVNVSRDANTGFNVSTAIATVGTGGDSSGGINNSVATLAQSSNNNFWATLTGNLATIMGESSTGESSTALSSIISNPESGLITVRATSRQHQEVRQFLDTVRTRSLYQVMIEATVVEVTLNDRYQAGVDWGVISRDNGQVDFLQSLTGLNLTDAPASMLTIDKSAGPDGVVATMKMLARFGDIRVLSSPKIMALNNQAAMLRVVDNKVYFTIEVTPGTQATNDYPGTPALYTSTINTVPVGFVLSVTPQISENDQVTLNVRPTISRILRYVNDPSPALRENDVVNPIPEIQIREIESILKVFSGQTAVLGGLMQDSLDAKTSGLPGLSKLPGLGNLFSYRDDTASKTELIIFIRPVVIKQPSLQGDLEQYKEFLPNQGLSGDGFLTSQFRRDGL